MSITPHELNEMQLFVSCVPINAANMKALYYLERCILEIKNYRKDIQEEIEKLIDDDDFNHS